MCDCFHLAFPNWHAPAAGEGRRLRGPEQEAEADSVCDDPEILETERPRPQGSSPVEEFPVEKQAKENISDSAHKSGSNKKDRKPGFGSMIDKHTSEKMNETENMQKVESEMIVKTVKEACVEGLVVTGGGKEGIFIKEVKQDSHASKHLSVKEGDQLLSATVYFDNVSYEDALQILEHAQPYKMEFCLKRKVEPTIPETTEVIDSKEKDQESPMMRSQRKMKKPQERISWPKFPSFGKGVQFKRSHSTSEAEEHRKLEMSPPTSDIESPFKSPLKCPDGKDKKKKHKVQLKRKMKGNRSKSVEEPQRNENELLWENEQVEDILEEKVPEQHEKKMHEIQQGMDGTEREVPSNDDPNLSIMKLHEAHLISLGNTLKTTDISVALAEGGKIKSSEMKVRIHQKEKHDIETENQAETNKYLYRIPDNVVLPQAVVEISQLDNDLKTQRIEKDSLETKLEYGNAELSMPNQDICVESTTKSPSIGDKNQWKERSVFENVSYGIRTRGPLADMATSKSHFVSTLNGLQFISPDFSETQVGEISDDIRDVKKTTVIFQPQPDSAVFAVDKEVLHLEIKHSKLPNETTDFILVDTDRSSPTKYKLPKVDDSGLVSNELIKMTEVGEIRTHLPKREDIEIPGMENKETKPSLQKPVIKVKKIEKIINITKESGIQDSQTEEFNVEDVKVAVSRLPAFKLPDGDITGVLVQREITIMDSKSDKLTPRGSPHKISITSTDSSVLIPKSKIGEEKSPTCDIVNDTAIKMPNAELITTGVIKMDYAQPTDNRLQITDYGRLGDKNFKLPKREDIEIPGMESIKETKLRSTEFKAVSDAHFEKPEKPKTEKHKKKKKSQKQEKNIKEFEITQPQTPDISTELPRNYLSKIDPEETKIQEKHKFKSPNIGVVENIDIPIQETKILDKTDLPQKVEIKFDKTKSKIPSIALPEFGTEVAKGAVEVPAVIVQVKEAEINLPEDKQKLSAELILTDLDGTDVNKDGQSVYGRPQDTETEVQSRKFKLPKFEISFPEVKAPRIICTSKKDDDSSISEKSGEVPVMHSPKVELQDVKQEVSSHLPEIDSEISEVKIKRPGLSFPRLGISKSEHIAQSVDVVTNVEMSLSEGNTDSDYPKTKVKVLEKDSTQKDVIKFSSPTKYKIPSIKFPHFGSKVTKTALETLDVHVDVKEAEMSLPDTIQLSAESILVDIQKPDEDKQEKPRTIKCVNVDIQSLQVSKFKLPKFEDNLGEVKEPEIAASSLKTDIDISVPKAKTEMHPPDVELKVVTTEMKTILPEVDFEDSEVKKKTPDISFPGIGFSKYEGKAPEVDLNDENVDVSLPEGSIEIERQTTYVIVSLEDVEPKGRSVYDSSTKFKLPSISLPKSVIKGPKPSVEVPDVGTDVKGPEISLPDAEMKLSAEPISVDFKGPDVEKDGKALSTVIKEPDIQVKEQGSKFKLPKFGISLPEVKGPKIDFSSDKAEIDISVPKAKVEVHPPDVEVQGVTAEIKAKLPDIDSKDSEITMKAPGFSFPGIGFSKADVKESTGDVNLPNVDVSLPEGSIEIERPTTDVTVSSKDTEPKARSKFGSPTKFKLPSFNLPKFGIKGPKTSVEVPDVDIDVKGPEISLPDAEMKLSAEPISVDFKGPDVDKEVKALSTEIKEPDIQVKEQGSKFKLPKFGISLPEVKGPKIDFSSDKAEIDISVPKAKVEVHPPDVEVQGVTAEIKAKLPDIDSKDSEITMKAPGFSFPGIGFSKADVKESKVEVSLPTVDVSLPEGSIEIERPTTDVTVSSEDTEPKARSKFGSPTKFKLPSFTLPKFGIKGPKTSVEVPDVDIDVTGPEISLPDAEMKLSAEPISVDFKGPDVDKEVKALSTEIKKPDIQVKEQGSKFKLPKFGISLPEVKGPKIDFSSDKAEIDISVPKAKVEVHPPDVEVQGVTAEIKAKLPDIDSKDSEITMKAPGFSFPGIGFSKSDVKESKVEVSLPTVDVSLPEGRVEIERPTTDVTVSSEDTEPKARSKFGSPTKFKLPSFTLPKFGIKGPKTSVEVPDVDIDVKGPEISLPDTEMKLSAEPISVDFKGPDVDKEVKALSTEIKEPDIQVKEQGSKFKLPKFGISLPEVKGPKIDFSSDKAEIDISVPKAKVEVHPPDVEVQGVTAEIKAKLPGIDSKDSEITMKAPGFSFPGIGFSKADVKESTGDVNLPNVDVSLPEGSIEIERPTTDVTVSSEDTEPKARSKFGSPTKFKLPSFNLPKFGIKGPKTSVEVPDVDIDVKGPEISLPDAEMKLSAEPISVDFKGPDVDKEVKALSTEIKEPDIQVKEQGSKFKLPKFGISLPEVKGPKIDFSSDKAEIDISVPKAKVEVHPPDVEVQGVTAEIKAKLPDIDSKDSEITMKAPGFSFPGFGFSKADVKESKVEVSLPTVDASLPEGRVEIERPTTDVTVSSEDTEPKARSKIGSPTKFKLPSINLPKFGIKGRKTSVEVPDVDIDVKGPEISLPDAEMKLSAEPISVDFKGPDVDKEVKALSTEIEEPYIQVKEQGSKFKLPKFGISLPEVKGPKIDFSSDKAETDISVPKAKVEVHPPDVDVQGVTAEIKAKLPDIDSKDSEITMKAPGFSFPGIGFSKSDVKKSKVEVSLPNVDVSLPEGSVEIERPTTDVTVSSEDTEPKARSKFGSPTKFKLPSFNLPKFGIKGPKTSVEVPDVDIDVKGPEISLPDAEMKLSAEPISVDFKGPDVDKEVKALSTEIEELDIQVKEQGSKFKFPKFGISLPEVKGPKIDFSSDKAQTDISVPKAKVEVHPPDVEVQGVTAEIKAKLPDIDSKDSEITMKAPGFSFPGIGFSKSDVKESKVEVSLPTVDVSLPEGSIEIERPTTDVTVSSEDTEPKARSKFGSPTKFKLPSFNLPKFGIKGPKTSVEVPDVDIDVKGPEISLPDTEMKLSAEPISVDFKGPDVDKEVKALSTEIKEPDIQVKEQGSKFKLPKFGISLPEVKGPKIDFSSDKAEIDISVPKAKVEVHPPDVEVQGVTAEIKAKLPDIDSKDSEITMKAPSFSFPGIGFSKADVKESKVEVSLPNVDVSLSEGRVEIERPTTDVTVSSEDTEPKARSKFGSPTKFKLPSINLPKFGIKGPKTSVEVPDVDIDVKGPEISLPDAEMKLSAEPISVDFKGPDVDKEVKALSTEIKEPDIQVKEQGSKFKLPKFGISLPEVKGPKIDFSSDKAETDISVPKAKVEVHPPDVEVQGVTAEIKAKLPDIDYKDSEITMKAPGFSFPGIGFSKSDVKESKVEVSLPNVDVSLPEGSIEIGRPTTDVTVSSEDTEPKARSKFGSPTKFKLPSINLPKFGIKGPKTSVEVPDVDIDVKGPEISLPDAEMKLSAEAISMDFKGPDVDKEVKALSTEIKEPDIQVKEKGSKFKLPKFGISLPEVKGPDISVPKAEVEVHPLDVEVQGVTAGIKAKLPDVDSKDSEVKMKRPGLSFPRFSKSYSKAPASDSPQTFDASFPVENVNVEVPNIDITESVEVAGEEVTTKLKFPSIKHQTFGVKVEKETVDISSMSTDVKDAYLSAEPLSVDTKGHGEKDGFFGIANTKVKSPEGNIVSKSSEPESGLFLMKEVSIQSVKVDSVEINNKATIPESDAKVGKCGDEDTVVNDNTQDVLEPKEKCTREVTTSSKIILATLGDVLSGFEVEFNIPKFDEIEEAKKDEDGGVQVKFKTDLNIDTGKEEIQPENNDWFRFPKFSSPTKTIKDTEKVTSYFLLKKDHSPQSDINEKESKTSFQRETFEDNISPTLSLSSSDAFADISSALTTEPIGLSLASPTKVKVKYSEPTPNAEVRDLPSDIITSTARTELISMQPHQPEKVNIPLSSETSSSSVHTLKQMSGHIVVSNVKSVSKTEHAAILREGDLQDFQTLPPEKVADSGLSLEETVMHKGHTIVEKHIVKEIYGDDKEKVFVTQRIQVFEGDSTEPISDDTTSSIQKLRDSVHTEKIRFFEGVESSKTIVMSTETLLRHVDFSTDENDGK